MVDITPPSLEHAAQIEQLLDHAFGADRQNKISYRYRDGVPPVADLSWVAASDGELLGTIQFWPARLGTETALLLGPIALWAGYVGQGVGTCLMNHALADAKAKGWKHVFLVGDPNYYRRFGFGLASQWGVTMPDEDQERFQGCLLSDHPPLAGPLLPLGAAYAEAV